MKINKRKLRGIAGGLSIDNTVIRGSVNAVESNVQNVQHNEVVTTNTSTTTHTNVSNTHAGIF